MANYCKYKYSSTNLEPYRLSITEDFNVPNSGGVGGDNEINTLYNNISNCRSGSSDKQLITSARTVTINGNNYSNTHFTWYGRFGIDYFPYTSSDSYKCIPMWALYRRSDIKFGRMMIEMNSKSITQTNNIDQEIIFSSTHSDFGIYSVKFYIIPWNDSTGYVGPYGGRNIIETPEIVSPSNINTYVDTAIYQSGWGHLLSGTGTYGSNYTGSPGTQCYSWTGSQQYHWLVLVKQVKINDYSDNYSHLAINVYYDSVYIISGGGYGYSNIFNDYNYYIQTRNGVTIASDSWGNAYRRSNTLSNYVKYSYQSGR